MSESSPLARASHQTDGTPAPTELEIAPLLPGLLAVAGVAAAYPWLSLVPSTLTAVLLAVAVLQVVYHAVASVVSGHELLQLVLWVFSACYLVVPAIYQIAYQQAAWQDYYIYADTRRVQDTLVVLNVCFAAFAAGARRRPHAVRSSAVSTPTLIGLRGEGRPRERLLALGLTGAALAMLPLVVAKTGVAALFTSRSARSEQFNAAGLSLEQAGGAVAAFYTILPGALALTASYLLLVRWRTLGRPPVALIIALVLLLVYSNPLANTRFVSLAALAPLVIVALQPRSRRGMGVVGALVVFGLFAVYPIANVFRSVDAKPEPLSLSSIDFDGFQQLVNTQQYVADEGHPLGSHVASAALFAVPRSVWPSKARPASIDVAEHRGYAFTNLSLPIFGEFYLDLGLPGAVLVLYGWGRLWRRLDDDWQQGLDVGGARLVPYLAIAQVGLIRGPLGAQIPVAEPAALLLAASLLPFVHAGRSGEHQFDEVRAAPDRHPD